MVAALLGWIAPAVARGDTVVFREGDTVEGRVTETDEGIRIELDMGVIVVDPELVVEIRRSDSALDEFLRRRRAAGFEPAALLDVARWATRHGLAARARTICREVLVLEPGNDLAHVCLGHVFENGRWLTEREVKLAAGFVMYGGVWLTPEDVKAREDAQAALRTERSKARREARVPERRPPSPLPTTGYWGYGATWPWYWGVPARPLPPRLRNRAPSKPPVVIRPGRPPSSSRPGGPARPSRPARSAPARAAPAYRGR